MRSVLRSRQIATGPASSLGGIVAAQLATAVFFLVLARRSQVDQFGDFAVVYGISVALATIADFGSSLYTSRSLANGKGMHEFAWWLGLRTAIQLPLTAAVAVGLHQSGAVGLDALTITLLCSQIVGIPVSQATSGALRALRSPAGAAWSIAIGNLVSVIAVTLSPEAHLLQLAAIGSAISWYVTSVVALVPIWPRIRPSNELWLRNPWRGATALGLNAATAFGHAILVPFTGALAGTFEAAKLGAVNRWVQPLQLLPYAASTHYFPESARANGLQNALIISRKTVPYVLLGLVGCCGLAIASTRLVEVFLGESYSGAASVLRLSALAAIPAVLSQPLITVLISQLYDRFVAVTNGMALILTIAMTALGATHLGALAAPIALGVSNSLVLTVVFARVFRRPDKLGQAR